MGLTDYASEMLCKLMKFRKTRTLCDTVVTTSDGELWAHSVVLAAASEQMCNDFLSCCDVARSHYKVNLLKCDSLSVEIVIHYLYTGRIIVPVSYRESTLFSEILVVCATLGMDVTKMKQVTVSFVKNSKDFEQLRPSNRLSIIAVDHPYCDSIQGSMVEACASELSTGVTNSLKSEILSPIHQNFNDTDLVLDQPKVQLSIMVHLQDVDESIDVKCLKEPQSSQQITGNVTSVFCVPCNDTTKNITKNGNDSKASSLYFCAECNETFASKTKLRQHKNMFHYHKINYRFTCEYCDKKFQYGRRLQKHIILHTGMKPFLCDTCGRRFTAKLNLEEHFRLYHTDERTFKCQYCQKFFISQHRKDQHEATHSAERLYTCESCGLPFKNVASLNRHAVKHSGVKPYMCPVCMRGFTQKTSMVSHMAIHSTERIWLECPICGKGISKQSNLTKHIDTHSIVPKTHACSICNKAFKSADYLARHMKRHGAKTHACKECGKTYRNAPLLRSHTKTHVKSLCEICEKFFFGIRALNVHQMKVHGMDKSNVCMSCGEQFSDVRLLREHRSTHRVYT